MLKSTWIPFTWAQNLNKLEILEEIGTIASQISKKVEFIPRLQSGELSSIFASGAGDNRVLVHTGATSVQGITGF